jgi:hypothetical protein
MVTAGSGPVPIETIMAGVLLQGKISLRAPQDRRALEEEGWAKERADEPLD